MYVPRAGLSSAGAWHEHTVASAGTASLATAIDMMRPQFRCVSSGANGIRSGALDPPGRIWYVGPLFTRP